ncbi:MAG: C2 family cysteine protease [Chloroflexota bacterium]
MSINAQQTARAQRHLTTTAPKINRRHIQDTQTQNTQTQKSSTPIIQLAREKAIVNKADAPSQVVTHNFRSNFAGVFVGNEKDRLPDNTKVDIDPELTDVTRQFVKVFYKVVDQRTNVELNREGYIYKKYIVPANPDILIPQDVQNQNLDIRYQLQNDPLFAVAPAVAHVKQGVLGDCYFLSVVASIVDHDPQQIKDIMTDLGNRVKVRFYQNGNKKFVSVNKEVPAFFSPNTNDPVFNIPNNLGSVRAPYARGSLWIKILEKAYVLFKKTTYAGIEGGTGEEALKDLLDMEASTEDISFNSPKQRLLPWPAGYRPTVNQNSSMLDRNKANMWDKEVNAKTAMFNTIFGNDQNKVNLWQAFITRVKISGKTLNTIQDCLEDEQLPAAMIHDMMAYLADKRLYSGYIGSGIYSDKDLAVFNHIKDLLGRHDPAMVTGGTSKDFQVQDGIHGGHAYTIFATRTLDDGKRQIQVRNPWGLAGMAYMDDPNAPQRAYGNNPEQTTQPSDDNDATFWIDLTHFISTFNKLYHAPKLNN